MLEDDADDDGLKLPKIKYSEKLRRIKEIEAYPNVLNSTQPDIVLEITMKFIDFQVKEGAFEEALEIINLLQSIDLFTELLAKQLDIFKTLYLQSAICYF